MTRHLRQLAAVVIALTAAVCVSSAPASGAGTASCSATTANSLEPDEVVAVACGAFAGPGSQVMLVNLTTGVCMPFVGWDVFLLQGGAWKRLSLPAHGGLTGSPAVPTGNDIRETIDIRRSSDLLCNPTGGTKTRLWHWNGTTFAPRAWTFSKGAVKNQPSTGGKVRSITSPSGNIQCTIVRGGAYCQTFEPPQHVKMDAGGKLDICHGQGCAGNAGEDVKFAIIPYGRSASGAGVRCSSAFTGFTCVITATGEGFVIARAGIKRVG